MIDSVAVNWAREESVSDIPLPTVVAKVATGLGLGDGKGSDSSDGELHF
jgi:hypothetical protein